MEVVCPSCRFTGDLTPYDIGSGPEVCCPSCDWCWGADGQPLKQLYLNGMVFEEEPQMDSATAHCRVCGHTETWNMRDAAGCAMTWHVYQDHFAKWFQMFGSKPPRDPRPETIEGARRL